MTERGLPIVDGAPACPFVAFEDDRDERATSPDHRHRCYAETKPAPRALAHQEAYCLSSSFPVCPTFQDWARREAAKARTASDASAAASAAGAGAAPGAAAGAPLPGGEGVAGGFAAGAAGLAAFDDEDASAPDFLARRSPPERGLAGSAADRMAGAGSEPVAATARADDGAVTPNEVDGSTRGAVGGGLASGIGFGNRRPKVGDTRPKRREPEGEYPHRYEARPTMRTRIGLSSVGSPPRLAVALLALVVAAIALFFLPTLLGIGQRNNGGVGGASGSPSQTPGASIPAATPTATPARTPTTYIVQAGDTMSTIAGRFGVSLAQLIEANRTTIPDADNLQIGDQLIIPVPDGSGAPAVSTQPSVAPSP